MEKDAYHMIQKTGNNTGIPTESRMLFPNAVEDSSATAYLALAEAYAKNQQHQKALVHFIKATLLMPLHEPALTGCAVALLAMKRPVESAVYAERAFILNPNPHTRNILGQALYQMGHYTEALAYFVAEADNHTVLGQRALCLTQLNRYTEARLAYQQALELSPNDPILMSNYAFCLLAQGDLRAGFQAFEWRWQNQLLHCSRSWLIPSSTNLSELEGKSILIHTEQGLGDSLHFFRYVLLLVQRGAHVSLEIQPALIPLLSSWNNTITLIAAGSPLPSCDYHFPIMSLAFIFQTELQNIPTPIPYVFSDASRIESCRHLLKKSIRKRVGIAWRGSALHQLNQKRSIDLQTLLSIQHPDCDYICLQQDVTRAEKKILDQHTIPYYGYELSTIEGTAALISCLDLIVTIDTSIAHLAGAMGKSVWILLSFSSDWRWLLNREDSPWYPTARLFRQTVIDDWRHPLMRVKTELNALCKKNELLSMGVDHVTHHTCALSALQQNNLIAAIRFMQQAAAAAPTIALYRRNLGELLRRVGQLDAAISSHNTAVDLEPHSAENHFHLGLALNDSQQYDAAVSHYRTALSLQPTYGLAWNNLGASLQCLGDTLGARDAYAQAIQLNPMHAEAQNNLGAIYSEQGHLDNARTHFTAAIAANPEFVEAHYNLSSLKTYTKDDPHLLTLEAFTQKSTVLSVPARIRFHFALGKALDDIGQYARAFQAYAEGNRLKYAQEPWNDAHIKSLTGQIKTVFTKPFLKKARKTKDTRTPIFIVGMPRSGTTLIEQILSSHESIYGAGELMILDEVIHSARGAAKDTPFTTWVAQLTDKECAELGDRYLERVWTLAPDKEYSTDKMPGNCFYIGMIYRMLPKAKIIHAMRDPMDTCFSCFTKLFNQSMPYAYDQDALGRYFMYYAEIMKHWHTVLPKGVIYDLPYESMVSDHENQTKKLLDYIGMPWDPNCLNFYKNERIVKTASVAQVRKPMYQTSVKRWKHFTHELQTLLKIVSSYRSDYFRKITL